MEGVGARLGRSSTRYGPTTVFTGPVRKWKKKWIHVTPPSSNNNNSNSNNNNNHHHHHHQTAANGTATNGNNGSHLLLYKWTPITASQNNNNNNNNNNHNNGNNNNKTNHESTEDSKSSSRDDALVVEEPRKRKFKYIPVAVLEEQKNEAPEPVDEAKPMETDTNEAQTTSKGNVFDEKPDINDVPAEENQAPENSPLQRQDLNESTLDLSLGLKAHDGENDSDPKEDQNKDDHQIERVNSSGVGT